MSNAVPEGWAIQPLNGKVEILSGYPFKSSLFCDEPSKIGVIRIRDLAKQSVETFYAGDFDDEYVVRSGDILIGMDGDFNIVKWKTKNALLNQRICKIKASKGSGVDSDFLFYSLVDDLDAIHAATGATTVKHLSVKDIKGIEKAYPPLPEQQKIAAILSSVDNVIEKTRAQIDKLKDLKTGMMQELLTKGIGHAEFKDSPVGRIPVEWEVKPLPEVSKNHDSKRVPIKSVDRANIQGGYRYYGASGIIDYVDDYIFDGTFILLGEDGENVLSRHLPLAFIVTGRFWVNNHAHVLQTKEGVDIHFLCEYLESIDYKNIASGSAQPKITQNSLNAILVPVPSLEEQKAISRILSSIDGRASLGSRTLEQLELAKKALMQDLLTGKVRVNIDDTEKESAAA